MVLKWESLLSVGHDASSCSYCHDHPIHGLLIPFFCQSVWKHDLNECKFNTKHESLYQRIYMYNTICKSILYHATSNFGSSASSCLADSVVPHGEDTTWPIPAGLASSRWSAAGSFQWAANLCLHLKTRPWRWKKVDFGSVDHPKIGL